MATIFNSGTPNIVANINVDQRTGEFHGASAQATSFAVESGSNRSDHIILAPDTIEISFVIENNDTDPNQAQSPVLGSVINTSTAYGTRAATEFQKLKKSIKDRELYDVVTRHYLYKSMALVDIVADTVSPYSGQLRGRVSFREFNEISTQVVDIPASQLNGTAQQSASSQIDAGRQEGQELTDIDGSSLLNQIFGG